MAKMGVRTVAALTIAAVLGWTGIAAAQGRGKQKPRQVPHTGVEKVPTPADAAGEALLEQMTSRSSEGLVEVLHPSGAVSIDLQGRFMSVLFAATGSDGRQTVSCNVGQQAIKKATSRQSSTPRNATGKNTSSPGTPAARELK